MSPDTASSEQVPLDGLAERLVQRLRERSWSIATGESLTAGLVSSTIASVPGCSAVFRGAVVAYAPEVKTEVLNVPVELLRQGIVTEEVARALAQGARSRLGATVGVGTTGAAGPDDHDGMPVGTACIAVCSPWGERVRTVRVTGDRSQVRHAVTQAAMEAALEILEAGE
ncbi:MAG: CinA family protein [Actinomycetota bacterium]|nr:CinA family protein [Actinomycetota bacterium]MED5528048.1 CinA family protein [Actinomycetota bacterium]MEE3088700.1 CinA family protein [Actinomycetota bacterium]